MIIDYLTPSGPDALRLKPDELPFTDFSPRGVEMVLRPEPVAKLVDVLDEIKTGAEHSGEMSNLMRGKDAD